MTVQPATFVIDPLDRALALIETADPPLRLPQLARAVGLSPSHLQRAFRKRFGVSPAEYARSRKLKQLKSALRAAPRVTDAIYDAGYGSGSRVYEQTGQLLGMTPANYKRGGSGVAIRYTTLQTPIGSLLVAASERGICAVTLGDDEKTLLAGLRSEFPQAELERVDAGRDEWLAAMIDRVTAEIGISAHRPVTDVPVDVQATAFQWRVWQALQRIPRGQTRSYAQIAAAIGAPRAVRAVASACARNHLAVVVPCHRVIRADGSLGGYRWGIPRKRALLENETKVALS
jgi:AraC family transcriptional regulator of adaptative response/methylated-DNA-[protein]-cysteine methyltransferase